MLSTLGPGFPGGVTARLLAGPSCGVLGRVLGGHLCAEGKEGWVLWSGLEQAQWWSGIVKAAVIFLDYGQPL